MTIGVSSTLTSSLLSKTREDILDPVSFLLAAAMNPQKAGFPRQHKAASALSSYRESRSLYSLSLTAPRGIAPMGNVPRNRHWRSLQSHA
jgi:predicted ATPase with chaperone activity